MIVNKFLAVVAMIGGLICCGSAYQNQAVAIECDPAPVQVNAECESPVVSGPHETQEIGGCQSSYYWWCVPKPGSNCGTVAAYGIVFDAYCRSVTGQSPGPTCIEDAGASQTFVVPWYQTDCQFLDGTCTCVYIIGSETYPNQGSEKCLCL